MKNSKNFFLPRLRLSTTSTKTQKHTRDYIVKYINTNTFDSTIGLENDELPHHLFVHKFIELVTEKWLRYVLQVSKRLKFKID